MFTSLTETNPASESRNPPSKSFVLNDSSINDKRISKVVQAPGFIRGINPKSKIENPQAPAFIRGVASKI